MPRPLNDFIGIPFTNKGRDFSGCDCWGLYRLKYHDENGIWLPSYTEDYMSCVEAFEVGAIISGQKEAGSWEEVETPLYGDLVAFEIGTLRGALLHIGFFVGRMKFLHAFRGTHSCIERVDDITWRNRFDGFYRHK